MDPQKNPELGNSLQVGFQTNYKSKNSVRPGKESNIFPRAFNYLTQEGKNPGKIVLLLLNCGGDYRVLGAFSENINGSISFFPDFSDKLTIRFMTKKSRLSSEPMDQFDHITLNNDFSKRGHLTNPKTKKLFMKHDPILLGDGSYCWLTIVIKDVDGLNDFPYKINTQFPITHRSSSDYISFIQEGLRGIIELKFPTKPTLNSFGSIQFLLIKKGWKTLPTDFFNGPLKTDLCGNPTIPDKLRSNNFIYQTSNNFGYDIFICAFNLNGKPVNDIFIITSTLNIQNPGH